MKVPLLKSQSEFLQHPAKFLAFVGGIGSGKTKAGSYYSILRMTKYPKALHFIGANSYGQLLDSTLASLFATCEELNLPYSFNQNHGLLKVGTGFALCKSMDLYDLHRGIEIGSFWLDEARDLKKEAFQMMMGRLRDKRAKKLEGRITTTANGYDWIYDYFDPRGQSNTEEFSVIRTTSYENNYLPQGYIDSIKSNYSTELFKQEVMGEFIDIQQGQAYYNFSQANIKDENPFAEPGEKLSRYLPICVAMDFNLNPMAWTLGQQRGKEFYWFDEIVLPHSNTPEATRTLIEKTRYHKPGLIICGDATGKARQRAAAGQSDYDIIMAELTKQQIKFINKTPESNPLVKDRVNTMNALLKDMEGNIHFWVHSQCKNLKKDLERVAWKETTGEQVTLDQTKDPSLTHSSDGVGYFCHSLGGLKFDNRPSTLKVIWR